MRTLMLMRHAKSSWDRPDLADLDRPLAPRGHETAPLVARHIKQSRWRPDLVLCSPATRVRETWQLMAPVLGGTVPCKTLRAIYPGAPSRLLETLRRAADDVATLMLIGHNPGLGHLAVEPVRQRAEAGARAHARQVSDRRSRGDPVRYRPLERAGSRDRPTARLRATQGSGMNSRASAIPATFPPRR